MGSSEDALYFQTRYNGLSVGHYLRYGLLRLSVARIEGSRVCDIISLIRNRKLFLSICIDFRIQ